MLTVNPCIILYIIIPYGPQGFQQEIYLNYHDTDQVYLQHTHYFSLSYLWNPKSA